jgi:5'(3')-deoxyribonucleotidase
MKDYLRASIKTTKPIMYIDMDGVLADFDSRKVELEDQGLKLHQIFKHPRAFADLEPIPGAVEAWNTLQKYFETYILSTPPWSNPLAWRQKREWVEQYLGNTTNKKLILCHNKGLLKGDYLIDDRIANGVADFTGEHIHFRQDPYHTWEDVIHYLYQSNGL